MITKKQRANAERIVQLADVFGTLPINIHGQTVEGTLNLTIPCARLVKAEIVTGVVDSFDAINDDAVKDVEATCRAAVKHAYKQHGPGWWLEAATEYLQGVPA
jgi:hypothetical protein